VTGDEFFTVAKPLQMNVYYINKGQAPVQNAYTAAALLLRSRQPAVSQADMDAEVIKAFEANLKQQQKDNGSTLGVDAALWTTPEFTFPLTQQMVDAILSGQLVLYVVSHARWKDSYDRPKETQDCVWLVPPTTSHPPLDSLVWHECTR
jgi:hypothetical protein